MKATKVQEKPRWPKKMLDEAKGINALNLIAPEKYVSEENKFGLKEPGIFVPDKFQPGIKRHEMNFHEEIAELKQWSKNEPIRQRKEAEKAAAKVAAFVEKAAKKAAAKKAEAAERAIAEKINKDLLAQLD